MNKFVKVAAVPAAVVAGLFVGSEVGVTWAMRLCSVSGAVCGDGPMFFGAWLGVAFGFLAGVVTFRWAIDA